MKQDDYKIDFEENRKEINLEEDDALLSRAEKYGRSRKTKKKSGNLTINVILGLFTLIPVVILIYVISDFYSPKAGTSAGVDNQDIVFEKDDKESGGKSDETDKGITDEDNKSQETGVASEKKGNSGTDSTDTKKPAVNVSPPTEKKTETVSKPEVKPEKKPEKKPESNTVVKTHTVTSDENLYRIALKYYGNGSESSVEKIRKANGLGTNEIRVGQNLIIP